MVRKGDLMSVKKKGGSGRGRKNQNYKKRK